LRPNGWDMIPSLEDLSEEPARIQVEIWAAAIAQAYVETDQLPTFGTPARNGWNASCAGFTPRDGFEEAGWLAREILAVHGGL